ncbi:4-hydroxy-3-methylbut-2-enyl diphosphate reductase, partial [Candidatus Roizmanbacteria bacterium]|nr:4-hydroxy-3-methylbut-2-enyl diphosphate reductase [Candidatus Roizmanbacteria bacterium]
MSIKQIYLAGPRGFCAGVERAVNTLDRVLKKYGPPVYARHAIVHNRHVVKRFERRGAIFVEDLNEIPDGSVVVLSAHGSPPAFYEIAKKKNLKVHDAMCPLVLKVHIEARKYANEGYFIFYVGHRGHPEPEGVMGNVPPESIALVETIEEALSIKPPQEEKLIVLTQTTLSFDDTKKIIATLQKKFKKLTLPPAFDICYATQNRQLAVKELAKKAKLVLVIGSLESSNSVRLTEVAKKEGARAYLIDDASHIDSSWLKGVNTVGITSGASAPDDLVMSVVDHLRTNGTKIQELTTIKEKVFFPL